MKNKKMYSGERYPPQINDLITAGTVVRVTPKVQQKASAKTKLFERVSELGVGTEQKEAA